jgi:hypothetical protein
MPRSANARAGPKPVGPASYATWAGVGKAAQNPATSSVCPPILRTVSSPDCESPIAATTFAA